MTDCAHQLQGAFQWPVKGRKRASARDDLGILILSATTVFMNEDASSTACTCSHFLRAVAKRDYLAQACRELALVACLPSKVHLHLAAAAGCHEQN